MVARDRLHHLADDLFHLVRERPAIGVAEHDPARAFVMGGLCAGECELRIGLVAVEKVFAVDEHFTTFCPRGAHAVTNRGKVLVLGGLERDPHVVIPGLRHEADGLGLGLEQRRQSRIVRGRTAGPPRHPECRQAGAQGSVFGEKLRIDRVGARIAALDIVDADIIEHGENGELVIEREVDAVCLRAVAQGGVEQVEAFSGHGETHSRR